MTTSLTSEQVDHITKTCLDVYNKLPKTGKPVAKEFTVLSCVVKYDTSSNNDIQVVSLGTGTKCIGATKMCPAGRVLNDSHAEVFARRGFLIYLYYNIEKCCKNESSIFMLRDGIFKLKDGIEFVFSSSQLPCGDASIIPKGGQEEHFGDILEYKSSIDHTEIPYKKRKVEDDIYRTGAKCLQHSAQDPREKGPSYHLLGQIRTKPGRGDRTLSVSCSDKMSRWAYLGIQGSFLSLICKPIYIKHFIFGAGVPYSEESLKRAILKGDNCNRISVIPKFYQSTISFEDIKNECNNRPAPGSIVWINIEKKTHEVAVQGKKLGITKKRGNAYNSSLCISKCNLYRRFLKILALDNKIKESIIGDGDLCSLTYNEMKRKSKKYIENWMFVKENIFKTWTMKPDIWDFRLDLDFT